LLPISWVRRSAAPKRLSKTRDEKTWNSESNSKNKREALRRRRFAPLAQDDRGFLNVCFRFNPGIAGGIASRATDRENIFSLLCKLLMPLLEKILRATYKACLERAARAIMRMPMERKDPILELSKAGAIALRWAAQGWRLASNRFSACTIRDPGRSPELSGIPGDPQAVR